MEVPAQVRAAALAAFAHRRSSSGVLPLLWDSLLSPATSRPTAGRGDRTLHFGDDTTSLRVEVTYGRPVVTLTVDVRPHAAVTVELVTPRTDLRLSVTGVPPLELFAAARGPVSLLLRQSDPAGSPTTSTTAWVVL